MKKNESFKEGFYAKFEDVANTPRVKVPLTLPLPKDDLAPKKAGFLSREILSQIFVYFIEAVAFMVKETDEFHPATYFIYSEKLSGDPVVFPVHIDILSKDALDSLITAAVKTFPTEKYNLEMIMYTKDMRHVRSNEKEVMFGAIDQGGTTVHSIFDWKKESGVSTLLSSGTKNDVMDRWIPPEFQDKGIHSTHDEFLLLLRTRYSIALSLERFL